MDKKYLITEWELFMLLRDAYKTGLFLKPCAEPDEEWYKAHEYHEKACSCQSCEPKAVE